VIDGRDVSAEIRGPDASSAFRRVSAHPEGARSSRRSAARLGFAVRRPGGGGGASRDIGTVCSLRDGQGVFGRATTKSLDAAQRDEEGAGTARSVRSRFD